MTIHLNGLTLTFYLLGLLVPCFWDLILILDNRRLKRQNREYTESINRLSRAIDFVFTDVRRHCRFLDQRLSEPHECFAANCYRPDMRIARSSMESILERLTKKLQS